MSNVFISHSSRDHVAAEDIASWLHGQGHTSVFLDFDPANGIPAGRDWEQELYRNIRACRAVIVLCSEHSMASRWCFVEITHARALGKHTFPIRLDDAAIDGVLSDTQIVDFRDDRAAALERLRLGLLAAGLDPASGFDWNRDRSPYPGLFAFQEEDAAVFFGRDEEIGEGLDLLTKCQRLGQTRFVIVLSASGSGKSSLVRAGLLPRLRRDSRRWLVVDPFRPRDEPFGECAAALSRAFARTGNTRAQGSIVTGLGGGADTPSTEDNAILRLTTELRQTSADPDATVLLTIDQFEELFGHPQDHPATRFLRLLSPCLRNSGQPLVVLATMRSDFLNLLQQAPSLLGIRYESLSLGPMSPENIIEVIERPAELGAFELDPALVQALVDDARSQDALPLLAFTLRELIERHRGGRVELHEYREGLGGMQGAVAKAAEEVVATDLSDKGQENHLRQAFLSLVRITDDGAYARRRAQWSDLPSGIHPLLERLVDARLLVSRDEGEGRVLEVAHEALFRSWGRLVEWLKAGAEALRLRQEVGAASHAWESRGRNDDDLWRGGRLARARELMTSGDLAVEPLEQSFVEASVRAEEAERDAEARRRRRRVQWLAAGAVAGLVLSAIAGYSAIQARRAQADASRAALTAEERAKEAGISEARARAAQNFAEHQRVQARLRASVPESFEAKALAVLAPKYEAQARAHLASAATLESGLGAWRQDVGLSATPSKAALSLEVLKARSGGSILLHYGEGPVPRLMLFDGGELGTFKDSLKPRLEALRQLRASGPLPLDLVVSSQTDMQHIGGLLNLVRNLAELDAARRDVRIDALWSNAFVPPIDAPASALIHLQQKSRLVLHARELGIPLNKPFSKAITLPEAGFAKIHLRESLSITVLGPPLQWLREFAVGWFTDWSRRASRGTGTPAPFSVETTADDVSLETFSDKSLELIPSPLDIVRPEVPQGQDRSYVNLGSIVLMVELSGRRILLPADSRGDILMAALAQAGYTNASGDVDLDVLVAPHGGSNRNVSTEFFRRVRARHYVFQANGTHTNPEVSTFNMLFEARRADARPFTIYLSYPPEEYRERYPTSALCTLFRAERARGTPFHVMTPAPDAKSMAIHLLRDVPELVGGRQDVACDLQGVTSQ